MNPKQRCAGVKAGETRVARQPGRHRVGRSLLQLAPKNPTRTEFDARHPFCRDCHVGFSGRPKKSVFARTASRPARSDKGFGHSLSGLDRNRGNGRNRRYPAVDAPFRRRTGVASIAPVANGGSTTETRPSLSTPLGFRRLRVGAGRVRRQLPYPDRQRKYGDVDYFAFWSRLRDPRSLTVAATIARPPVPTVTCWTITICRRPFRSRSRVSRP